MQETLNSIEVNNTTDKTFENIDILSNNIPKGLIIKNGKPFKLCYQEILLLSSKIDKNDKKYLGKDLSFKIKIGCQIINSRTLPSPNGFTNDYWFNYIKVQDINYYIDEFNILKIEPKDNFIIEIYPSLFPNIKK